MTGTKYRFKVLAVNSVAEGAASAYLEMMPASQPEQPGPPTTTATSSTSVTFEWTEGENGGTPVTDYKVYWDGGISGSSGVAAATTGSLRTFTTTSVTAGTSYVFWVSAVNFVGEGTASTQTTVLAASVPLAPAMPTVTATYSSVSLTWVAPDSRGSTVTEYDIYWDSDGNSVDNFASLATTSNLFHTITTGITQGITYKFKIVAKNAVGSSDESPIGLALAASTPEQPATLTKLSGDTTSITVQWVSPDARGSPITNYDVYWDEGVGGDPRTLLTTTVSTSFSASTTQKIADLTDGQTYKFSLVARNAIGSSAYADTAAIIAATVPDTPATPTILAANSASIEI